MRRSTPDVALRVQVGVPESLTDRVAAGALDVAVMFAPQCRPGARVELLLEEKLVLVTTNAEGYVYIDWGPDFAHHHELSLPEGTNPGLFVDLGPLALTYILEAGGSGYFASASWHRTCCGKTAPGQRRAEFLLSDLCCLIGAGCQ